MAISPLAGKPAPKELLIDVAGLEREYFERRPDMSDANQWVSFIAFLVLGIGGMWYVLTADRPSWAINLASVLCPLAMFYCVVTVLIARPGTEESADPLLPFLFLGGSFGFAIAAMLVPLLSEFDVALGRTTLPMEE